MLDPFGAQFISLPPRSPAERLALEDEARVLAAKCLLGKGGGKGHEQQHPELQMWGGVGWWWGEEGWVEAWRGGAERWQ